MGAHAPASTDERTLLAGYLRQQQDGFRNAAFGLTDEQLAATPTVSALAVGTLIKHETAVQQFWLSVAEAAPGRPEDDRDDTAKSDDHANQFRWLDTDRVEEVIKAYDDTCAAVLRAVERLDLDTPAPVPQAPWFPKDQPDWSVRWVWLHLIEELARHAGHADIIREAIDGATMFELMAGREGWPESPWIKPWRPTEHRVSGVSGASEA